MFRRSSAAVATSREGHRKPRSGRRSSTGDGGGQSNAQHDQRYKSDADEQHYERDGVVFEPMPITGKH